MSTNGTMKNDMTAEEEDIGPNLAHVKSSGAMTISPELFEKLYLTPKTQAVGDFRKRFANPTPLGFMGFVISSLTFSAILMGWGGATTLNAVLGIFYFTGPFLLMLSCIFEWIMGNFLSMIIAGMFGVFWLSFGVLETPTLQLAASYSSTNSAAEGAISVGYNAAIALYLMVWGFWLLTIFVFTLKTNVALAAIFLFAPASAFTIGAAYWKVSTGDFDSALKLQKAGGALFFVLAMIGWYLNVVMIAAEMRMTVRLPVGDLSHLWPNVELSDLEKNE